MQPQSLGTHGAAWQNFTQAQRSHMVALHGRSTLRSMVFSHTRKEVTMTRLRITQRLACTALVAAMAGIAAPSFAQPGPGAGPVAEQAQRPRQRAMAPEQRQQYMQQRMEAFKQKLQLTPAQEPAWNSFVQSMQSNAEARHARLDWQGMDKLTTPERIDRMRAMHAQRGAEMERRGESVKAFYAQLTQAQQKTFDEQGARMYGQSGAKQGRGMHRYGQHHGYGPGPLAAPAAPAAQ